MNLNNLNVIFYISFSFILNSSIHSQRTVGLLKSTSNVSEGYILFSPLSSKETFLIDNCGYLVKKWVSEHVPGQTAYLLPNGDLLRTARIPGFFTGGGTGGKIEIFDWEGILKWSYVLANEKYHQHHIAHPMPNGNILTTVWYKYSKEEAIQKGFRLDKLTNEGIWSDRIIEIKPLPGNKAEIVWEWDFWDHTIQNYDSIKSNYGFISEHPELLDVNFFEDPGANIAEWIHLNALDYNPQLDQIIVSSKYHNEFYIIDHSTTTNQAKGHTSGKYGKGGDFLYRWGNPRSYGRGTQSDHWLYGQHDVQWIDDGLPGEGNILLFNNGSNRTGQLYSSVEEIIPPIGANGNYILENGKSYKPLLPIWVYQAEPRTSFYSSRISGAERMLNGNTVICEGNKGNFFEVDRVKNNVWQYENPVNTFGAAIQGNMPINNDVFKISKYSADYPAFTDKLINRSQTIEINLSDYNCEKLSSLISQEISNFAIYPNPTSDYIYFNYDLLPNVSYQVSDILGKVCLSGIANSNSINTSSLREGLYFIKFSFTSGEKIYNFTFLKK